eukprot:s1582_g8.t1
MSRCALSGGKLSLLKCVSAAAPVQRQRTQGRESNGEGAQDTKRQMRLRLAACLSVVAGSVSSPVSKFRVEGGIRRHVVDMYGGGGHVPPLCRDVSQRDVEGHPLLQEGLCHSSCNTVCHWLEVVQRSLELAKARQFEEAERCLAQLASEHPELAASREMIAAQQAVTMCKQLNGA